MRSRWSTRRSVATLAALALSGAGLVTTATATPTDAADAAAQPRVGPGLAGAAEDERWETFSSDQPVAPGVTMTTFERYGPDAVTGDPTWLQGSVLSADLSGPVTVERFFPGTVSERDSLTTQANQAGAVAGFNASYFDINGSGAPWGVAVQDGELLQSPHIDDPRGECPDCSVAITESGWGEIGQIMFEGTVRLSDGSTVALDAINKPEFQIDSGIMAFTPVWGEWTRDRPTQDTDLKIEIVVTDGSVSEISDVPGEGQLPDGSFTLVGRGDGVAPLAELAVGDPVGIDYEFRSASDQQIRAAVSGRHMLVADGVALDSSGTGSDPEPHPRTAIGFSQDGTQMYVVTVDGRQPEFSEGVSLDELADMMVELGAYHALNLDGGGSTTLAVRDPGADLVEQRNRSSELPFRPVPDGLGLFVPEGTGNVEGLWVETAVDPDRTAGSTSFVPRLRTDRVFPGLTRTLTADGYDEMYSPAEIPGRGPIWRTDDPRVGHVDRDGTLRARSTGETTVTASHRRASGEFDVTVLGDLERLGATSDEVVLTDSDGVAAFDVIGYDAQGYSAPIEPADVHLDYDAAMIDIAVTDAGAFEVSAEAASGTGVIEVEVQDETFSLPVSIGLDDVVVADFEDADSWEFLGVRAEGTARPTGDGLVGTGLELTYDFTQDVDTTRGVGAWPAERSLPIPGEPRELRLSANTSGRGLRARLEVFDGNGEIVTLEHGFVDEPGWQQLTFEVPADVTYPIALRRFYFNELEPGASYEDSMVVDELVAMVPPDADAPAPAPVVDPIVVPGGVVEAQDWRFAVVADASVDAADPDGAAVERARRSLREIGRSDAEVVVVNGNFVASGTAANLAFARDLLDEELGEGEYVYVPGPQERHAGTLEEFREVFGDPSRVVDHRRTRFIVLDTSARSYRSSDWTQLPLVSEQLDAAAGDDAITSVVVVQGVALRDAESDVDEQLSDRKEVATIEDRLTEFQERTGTPAVLAAANTGAFHADRVDGVPQVLTGPAAGTPGADPASGGFTGWSLWGVNENGNDGAIAVELRPHVDDIDVGAPATVRVGGTAEVTATIGQAEVAVPVRYPVSADWSGSDTVFIGDPDDAGRRYVAAFDPRTSTLTALRPGSITLGVTVNGRSATTTVDVVRRS